MNRMIWLLVVVGALYSANEVRTKGIEGAFGGVLEGELAPLDSSGSLTVDDSASE